MFSMGIQKTNELSVIVQGRLPARAWTRTHAPSQCQPPASGACWRSRWGGAGRMPTPAGHPRSKLTPTSRTTSRPTTASMLAASTASRLASPRTPSSRLASPRSSAPHPATSTAPTSSISTSASLPVKVLLALPFNISQSVVSSMIKRTRFININVNNSGFSSLQEFFSRNYVRHRRKTCAEKCQRSRAREWLLWHRFIQWSSWLPQQWLLTTRL